MLISNRRQCAENRGLIRGMRAYGWITCSAGDKQALAIIPEIDIWRAASLMLKRYGEKALEESAARADELFAEQDHDGAAVWRRVIDAVGQLATQEPLNVRIGIATGLVVVGDLIGTGAAQERGVVGETPNLAARLQALARPGTLVV